MDSLLQGLQEVEGVLGSLVINGAGQLVACKAHSLYPQEYLEQVSRTFVNGLDTLLLLEEGWEGVTVQFADGKLLLRNLGVEPGMGPRPAALVVIADGRLNPAFAGVAIRVAASRIKASLGSPGGHSTPSVPQGLLGQSQHSALHASHPGGMSRPSVVAENGLSWSGLGGSSALGSSGVMVADAASSAYLSHCTKALAQSVGPMAKVFVKEAVRRLFPNHPFSRAQGRALVTELEKHIESGEGIAQFRRSITSIP